MLEYFDKKILVLLMGLILIVVTIVFIKKWFGLIRESSPSKNNKNLFKDAWFLAAVYTPLFFSLLFVLFISYYSESVMAPLTKVNIDNFRELYNFPLTILWLIIPLAAITVANYRSKLAVKAIKVSESQNHFTNYYSHREYFNKNLLGLPVVKNNPNSYDIEIDTSKLYSLIFNKSSLVKVQPHLDLDSYRRLIKIFEDFCIYDKDTNNEQVVANSLKTLMRRIGVKVKFNGIVNVDEVDLSVGVKLIDNIYSIILSGLNFGIVNNDEFETLLNKKEIEKEKRLLLKIVLKASECFESFEIKPKD